MHQPSNDGTLSCAVVSDPSVLEAGVASSAETATSLPGSSEDLPATTPHAAADPTATDVSAAAPASGFARFGFGAEILKALAAIGYSEPSPIQQGAIPELLLGRDLVGQAQTGTGKTAAFALPVLARIDPSQRKPQVLVLAPTRELALQVAAAFNSYAAQQPSVRTVAVYGGADFRDQIHQLKR
ncbi:MAG: DEAD/DEAH box helicase, partial [Cyanobium sp.]